MVYDGTNNSELIVFHTVEDSDYQHFIGLYKDMNSQVLSVGCCCDRDWGYKFFMTSNSDYERIKFNIMEAVFECENVDELLNTLDEIFCDGFSDIMLENECGGHCDCCDENDNNEKNVYFLNENNKYLN